MTDGLTRLYRARMRPWNWYFGSLAVVLVALWAWYLL